MKKFVVESRGFYDSWSPLKEFKTLKEASTYKGVLIPEKDVEYRIVKVETVTETFERRQMIYERA
jgi:hypothetical protein